ncbi:MAG: hypothetical protein E7425_09100 [Ruminococcaceae bacterium]|nr:hypothetical protein [Oscillospiraceae bacterium]
MDEIIDYIIAVGTANTTTGNWHVAYYELSEAFDFATPEYLRQHHDEILYELDRRAEILSETWTDYDETGQPEGFDSNFAIAYCLNANDFEEVI